MALLLHELECQLCGLTYPKQFVKDMALSTPSGLLYAPTCAICADEVMPGGLHGMEATAVLRAMKSWLTTDEGRWYIARNNWYEKRLIWYETENGGYVKMITPVCRVSYVNVFAPRETPSGQMKYSISILVPKEDTEGIQMINQAIQEAVAKGVERGTFSKKQVAGLRFPLRDGDAEVEMEKRGPEYKGHFFFNASSDGQPGVVNQQLAPIMDKDEFYSGCYARLDVNFFPYNTAGNRGIGAGLNNCMKIKDGDRLDGRMKAEDAFEKYKEQMPDVPDTEPDGGVF